MRLRTFGTTVLLAAVSVACGERHRSPTARHLLVQSIQGYCAEHGSLPRSLYDLLTISPRSGETYISALPIDYWRRPYAYAIIEASNRQFEIRSAGEDGVLHTQDDIVSRANASPSR